MVGTSGLSDGIPSLENVIDISGFAKGGLLPSDDDIEHLLGQFGATRYGYSSVSVYQSG